MIKLRMNLKGEATVKEGDLAKINNTNVYVNGKLIGELDHDSVSEEEAAELKESFDITPYKLGLISKVEGEEVYEVSLIRMIDIHGHTGYSLLDGALKIKDKAAKAEYFSAITDHGNVFGALEFYKAMKDLGKFPFIGCEVYMETIDGSKESNHLILLVKDMQGYHNVCYILSEAENNFYKRAHVSYDLLEKYHEGLICTSACLGGEVSRNISRGDMDRASEVAETLQGIFGDDFYIEIQHHEIKEEEEVVNPELIRLAKNLGIKIVGGIDSHYLNKEDAYAHEVLLCIQTGKTMNDPSRYHFSGTGYHVHSPIEFERKFKDTPEAIYNLYELAQKINFEFELGNISMPDFPVPAPFKNEDEYFIHLCKEGLKERFKDLDVNSEDYKIREERLDYEIETIVKMGYCGYFLIVWDFIKYARDNHIPVGPGRGSAVGSIASYCLRITNIDPIPYDLLFERFLNTERVSLPDIDIDFADSKRSEVIEYVKRKYGEDRVSGIITFGTLAARVCIKDVGRALGIDYAFTDKLSKMVPAEVKMTITKAFDANPEFKKMYETEPDAKKIIDIALRLEGLPRHKSQHACGKVVAKRPVVETCPEVLLEDSDTKLKSRTASFNMTEIEELGLVKMDFLGLRNMTVLGNSIDDIIASGIQLTEDTIPVNDPYVYELISTGNTLGIFQIESDGMQNLMKQMFSDVSKRIYDIENKYGMKGFYKVESKKAIIDEELQKYKLEMAKFGDELFERLIAAISLYRPGPMDYIPEYIDGMLDPAKIKYDTPELEEILSRTYGVIVYQEQVQQIVRKLAGYSLSRGDIIRRAMGKKKADVMAREQNIFIYGNADSKKEDEALVIGCVENGISEEAAKIIWAKMVDFAKYAFNKSHSAGYANIAVKTAFLKTYYPTIFMCNTINSVIGKADLIKKYLHGSNKMGLVILPPSINHSFNQCTVENDSIRLGLSNLRNLGQIAKPIIEERTRGGAFKDFESFLRRCVLTVGKKSIEALAYSSALDCFDLTRKTIVDQIEVITSYIKSIKEGVFEEIDFKLEALDEFYANINTLELTESEEFNKTFKLDKELEYAGFYLTEHPLSMYTDFFAKSNTVDIEKLLPTEDNGIVTDSALVNSNVRVGGIVKDVLPVYTKKNKDLMYILKVEDQTEIISCVIFPKALANLKNHPEEKMIVLVEGVLESGDRGSQIIVTSLKKIDEETEIEKDISYLVTLRSDNDLELLDEIIEPMAGNALVYFTMLGSQTEERPQLLTYKATKNLGTMALLKDKFVDVRVFQLQD